MERLAIDAIHLWHTRIAFGCSYATDRLDHANSLVVAVSHRDLVGWGEVFLPRVEPQWTWAGRVLPPLLGADAGELDALLDRWPAAERPKMSRGECSTYCHPEVDLVAEATSFALHDLVARSRGVPIRELFGPVARTEVPGMPCVTLGAPEAMAELAAAWAGLGYRHVKLKLAGTLQDDLRRVAAARRAVGDAVSLQVDANNSYVSLDNALELIAALNEQRVEVVEDLFGFGELADCRRAKDMLTGKYMVDKDAYWPNVLALLEQGVAALVNQHPHNQGRVSYALNIARAAAAAGVSSQIGASGILGVQNAAYQQLAAVVGVDRPCEDIGLHRYHDGPSRGVYRFDRRPSILVEELPQSNGLIHLNGRPGLGVEVDLGKLRCVAVKELGFA